MLVTAEVGVNHDGQIERALALVDAAARADADAVKLQLFHPDRLLSNQARLAAYQNGKAEDAYDLLVRLTLDLDEMAAVGKATRKRGLRFIVTPFSLPDVDDLRALDVDAVKIASPDAVNTPLLIAAATLSKPLLISTGTCDLNELSFAAGLLRQHTSGGALLHCVSSYPAPRDATALGAIRAMDRALGLPVGYSDHTTHLDTGALAVAAGAVVLEKHLTYATSAEGPDHSASLTPDQFAEYVHRVRDAQVRLGHCAKRVLEVERDVRVMFEAKAARAAKRCTLRSAT